MSGLATDLRNAFRPPVAEISFDDGTYCDEEFFAESIRDGFAGWYDESKLVPQIDFILGQCEVKPRSEILDLACGHGKHAELLFQRGHHVVATDISETLIAYLRETHGEAIRFEKRSFAELNYAPLFDLAIVLGNSLSLIPREELPPALVNIRNSLKKDGQLFIELDNRAYFIQNYAGKRRWDFRGDRWLVFSEYYYDNENRLEKTRDVSIDLRDMKVSRFQMTKSLYDYAEVAGFLASAGMAVTKSWGDWDGSGITGTSPSLLIAARKEP